MVRLAMTLKMIEKIGTEEIGAKTGVANRTLQKRDWDGYDM